MKPFTFFSDNAHGWLRVSVADCRDVELSVESFSRYSYCDDGYLYLEEDCDAAKFIGAFVVKYDAMPVIYDSHTHGQSSIRSKARL